MTSHGSLSLREKWNKDRERELEGTEARRLLSVRAEVSVNHPDYCKKKKKPQRHISAPSALHKGKHQSTAVWPPITICTVSQPCTTPKDTTAMTPQLEKHWIIMWLRVWVCMLGILFRFGALCRMDVKFRPFLLSACVHFMAVSLICTGQRSEPVKIKSQIKLEVLDGVFQKQPVNMASNSIFETFPSYQSCFTRGESLSLHLVQ